MSMIESPSRETPAQIRRRLLNPIGGHKSSELEVIAIPAARRLKLEQMAADEAKKAAEAKNLRREQDRAVAILAAQRTQVQLDDWKTAQRLIAQGLADVAPRRITMGRVIAEVCTRYRVEEVDICSARRTANIVLPRQIAMYLCKILTLHSLPIIGRRIGGRDHTTVLHGVRKIAGLVDKFPHLAEELQDIRKTLEAE